MVGVAFVVAQLLALVPPEAAPVADPNPCGAEFSQWAVECSAQTGVTVVPEQCSASVAVVAASIAGRTLHVELRRQADAHDASRTGPVRVSPTQTSLDSETQEDLRRVLEPVRDCVARHEPAFGRAVGGVGDGPVARVDARALWAWSTIAAWIAFVAWLAGRRRNKRDLAAAVLVGVVALVFRDLAMEPAFFHQNGHGPSWIESARCGGSAYGPGYASLFHFAALTAGASAERGVFLVQECLAALAVSAVYAIARLLLVSRRLALVATLALACDPLLGRLARSESYFATALALLTLAAAALLASGPQARPRDFRTQAGAMIGGMVAGLAITVHPAAWVPAACLPALALLPRRSGRTRRHRLTGALLSALVFALAAMVVALPSVLAVVQGSLGAQWNDHVGSTTNLRDVGVALLLPWVLAALLPRRAGTWLVPLSLLYTAELAADASNMFNGELYIAPALAWQNLFRLTALAAGLALLAGLERRLWRVRRRAASAVLPAIVLAVGVGHALLTWSTWTALPTDALETRAFAAQLRALPPSAPIYFLMTAGSMGQEVPIYASCPGDISHVVRLQANEPPPAIPAGAYWFRASTCATTAGRPYCEAVERSLVLRSIQIERLPSRPSLPYMHYDSPEIESGLFHVEALRSAQ